MNTSIALLALLTAGTADAYEMRSATHTSGTHTLYYSPLLPLYMPDHVDTLDDAAAKVNANASDMRFAIAPDGDLFYSPGNGESEAGFTSDAGYLCGSLACATIYISGGNITEADVYFDIDYDWVLTDVRDDNIAYGGPARPLINTAIHEFTHTLGAKHEDAYFNIMGNAWNVVNTNGGSTETVISEDTTEGLVSVYGLRPDRLEDLSLYHWRLTPGSVSYSNHERYALYDTGGVELPAVAGADEPAYEVEAGDTIHVGMTAENRGRSTQRVVLEFFVSTNDTITTYDTSLDRRSIRLGPNTPYERDDYEVTLPDSLNAGQSYWVGAIIDVDGTLSESNEANNAVYIAEIQVQ